MFQVIELSLQVHGSSSSSINHQIQHCPKMIMLSGDLHSKKKWSLDSVRDGFHVLNQLNIL